MRLLLAEDEVEMANALAMILKHNKYAVDVVHDGETALDYLSSDIYDGVILDVMMPQKTGFEVLKALRARGDEIPVLMLTARSETDDKVFGLDEGADDYLTKPFAAKELLARIRSMLRRQIPMTDLILTLGDINLNRRCFELSGPKGLVRLPNKEFQMLELMMLHPKTLVTRDYFMEKIWGYDSESEINVVWVTLSSLRKKLAQVGSRVQIKASRHLGYSLEVSDD